MKALIIIGAGRSGTNMLRDVICALPGFATWPCDEINYMWRHGNREEKMDEFSGEMARPEVCKFIRDRFAAIARKLSADFVVEKTCANSLRVEFVDRVIPEAKYLFIIRDGRDVVASAFKRWKAPLELVYLIKKARFVPASDLPYYSSRYFINRLRKIFSADKRLASWGPRFKGMEEALQKYKLKQVAALQWQRCVENSERGFQGVLDDRVCRLKYEELVSHPAQEFKRVLEFLDVDPAGVDLLKMTSGVSSKNIGKWRNKLSDEELQKDLLPLIGNTLDRYGYV